MATQHDPVKHSIESIKRALPNWQNYPKAPPTRQGLEASARVEQFCKEADAMRDRLDRTLRTWRPEWVDEDDLADMQSEQALMDMVGKQDD